MASSSEIPSRSLIYILLFLQCVHIFDGVMVAPLAPDFAASLGFPISSSGLITGAYSLAAAIAGFISALFLDRFSRKHALLFCLAGLAIATFACAHAWNLQSMVAFRFLAGCFGGPMFAIAMAFVVDHVSPAQRGKAMGRIMNAFPLVSIFGVPLALELAHQIHWQAPFYTATALAILGGIIAAWRLPYHPPHADAARGWKQQAAAMGVLLQQRLVWAAYGMSALAMAAGFLLIPYIAPYIMMNMDYPRENLGILYFVGGLATIAVQYVAGWMVDRTSATLVSVVVGAIFITNLYQGFVLGLASVPVVVTFALFMMCLSGRGVAAQALASQVPPPPQRGAYMAMQSSIIQVGMSSGAYVASRVVTQEGARLANVDTVAMGAIGLSLFIPLLFWYVERRVKTAGAH